MARQGSAGGAINYGSCRVLRLLRRDGLAFIILTPGTGSWGSLEGHHAQGHEPGFSSLPPSLLLGVLSHPEGPADPSRAWGMSTTFPKKAGWTSSPRDHQHPCGWDDLGSAQVAAWLKTQMKRDNDDMKKNIQSAPKELVGTIPGLGAPPSRSNSQL